MQTDNHIQQKQKFDFFKHAIRDKERYTKLFMTQILPQIAQISNQPPYGYHGLSHTTQVALFASDLALATQTHVLPVLLAAGLHDCARTHDNDCALHGPRCEKIARKFLATNYPTLSNAAQKQIVFAVVNHSRNITAPDMISACLWDGDRIRLAWEMGYDAKFFATEYGRTIASLPPHGQAQYMARQERFLINHGIKTRAQIEYDKMMDSIYCTNATVFKSKTM